MKIIEQYIIEKAICFPEKVAIYDEKNVITYMTLVENVIKLSNCLDNKYTLKKGDRIIVECSQSASYLIIALACHLSNIVFVPCEKDVSEERFNIMIEAIKPSLIVRMDENADRDRSVVSYSDILTNAKGFCGESSVATALVESFLQKTYEDNELSEILYTTGTTGKPKGIMISHANNVAVAENIIAGTEMKEDNVEIVPLPLSHSHGLRTCYANLMNGSTIVLVDGVMNVKYIYETIERCKVTSLDLTPSAAKVLIKLTKGKLADYSDQIDYIELGTAVLDEDTKQELKQLFPKSRLYNFYGSTEAGRCCVLDFNTENDIPYCIGFPAINAEFAVRNDNREIISSSLSEQGLLSVKGKMNMLGYWQADEVTQTTLIDGYIYTSDLSYIDDEGRVFVLGRADDVINYKGIKISPEEIEGPALKYEGVIDCACVPIDDKMCGQAPKLYIKTNDTAFDISLYRGFLKSNLGEMRCPKEIEIIDEIPRTNNGKLLRKKLR